MSYRDYPPSSPLLFGYDPEHVLPPEHLARLADRIVDASLPFAKRARQVGNQPYDPRLLVKVLVYGCATGARSSRQLERLCTENLAYRFLTRGVVPSYHTLSTARTALESSVELCWTGLFAVAKSAGMCMVGRIDLDSTKIRANAGSESVVKASEYELFIGLLRDILDELRARDEQEDAEAGGGSAKLVGDDQMREVLRHVRKVVKAETGDRSAPEKSLKLGPKMTARLESAVNTLTMAKEVGLPQVSVTDPEARMMPEGRGKKILECHSFEAATDNGLLTYAGTSNEVADSGRLAHMVAEASKIEPVGVKEVVADSGYFCTDEVLALEDSGMTTCVPDGRTAQAMRRGVTPTIARAQAVRPVPMTYNEEANSYECPQGNVLAFTQRRKQNGRTWDVYRARTDCTECPLKAICLSHKDAKRRVLKVGVRQERIDEVLARFDDPAHQAKYHERGSKIESVFGFIKAVLGFRQWQLRGSTKVASEGAILKVAYQMRKVHAAITAGSSKAGRRRKIRSVVYPSINHQELALAI